MGFYQDQIVPLLISWSMRQKNLVAYRSRIIPAAEGSVLEIGIGSGLNLPFYSHNVTRVIGLEPSPKLLAMARQVEGTGLDQFSSRLRPRQFRSMTRASIPS
jgi:protein-L-isoaspartate O-methyltransferase